GRAAERAAGQEVPEAGPRRRGWPIEVTIGVMGTQTARPAPRPAPVPAVRLVARPREAGGSSARLASALLLPAAAIVFGVVLYPAGRALVISFYDVDSPFPGAYPFRGLANYAEVLSDRRVLTAAGHTLYFTVVSTAAELLFGIGLALLLAAPLKF